LGYEREMTLLEADCTLIGLNSWHFIACF
jgi:hypothetical protein